MHLFLAHFPVALLLVGAAGDLLGTLLGKAELRRWAGWLLIAGGAGAVLAWATGEGALSEVLARRDPPWQRIETHTFWGGAALLPLVGAAALRAVWRRELEGVRGVVLLAVALLSGLLVTVIAVTGTAISHGS